VQGTKIGTQSKADGSFQIVAPASATNLVVTNVGFKQKIVPIESGRMEIALEKIPGATLNEVVVIGYGTGDKDVTGSRSIDFNGLYIAG
jgi:hypothetical protein